jgi:hypothetical protein
MVGARVARFFLIKYTKTGYTTPNLPINYPMSINYSKWQKCIPNFYVHKIYQPFLVQGHQKFIQIEIFGQKIYLPSCLLKKLPKMAAWSSGVGYAL